MTLEGGDTARAKRRSLRRGGSGKDGLLGVRWLAPAPHYGIGAAAAAYISGLEDARVPVSWSPLGWPSDLWGTSYGPCSELPYEEAQHAAHLELIGREIEHDAVVVCSTPLWHPALEAEAAGRRLVAYTTCESDRLSAQHVEVLSHFDAVLVPSTFSAKVFADSGVTPPVEVVPHCAPLEPPEKAGASRGHFVFYTIATWTTRKAILETVEAFVRAFDATEDVSLVIHTTPEDQVALGRLQREPAAERLSPTASWFTLARALAGRGAVPEVVLSTRLLPPQGISALHERGDCFVSLSRGEAWNLAAFDAAAHGNPVIVTGWGGHLDYLPNGYPYCVGYDLVPTTCDEPDAWWVARPGERWARADVEEAASLMRHVFEHREEAYATGADLRNEIGRRFAAPTVTEQLIGALSRARPSR